MIQDGHYLIVVNKSRAICSYNQENFMPANHRHYRTTKRDSVDRYVISIHNQLPLENDIIVLKILSDSLDLKVGSRIENENE